MLALMLKSLKLLYQTVGKFGMQRTCSRAVGCYVLSDDSNVTADFILVDSKQMLQGSRLPFISGCNRFSVCNMFTLNFEYGLC